MKCAEVDERRKPIPGTEFVIRADLAFIAIGFAGPFTDALVAEAGEALAMKRDARGNVAVEADDKAYATSMEGVYAAGDVRRGQSLVVWAIREGRQAARAIDLALTGQTTLPR